MGAPRRPGASVRVKLTLSYAGFLMVAGVLLIAVVWVFLLRYVPDAAVRLPQDSAPGRRPLPDLFIPGRYDLWRAFAPRAALALGLLLVLGLVGGWLLAGRMLSPLRRVAAVARATAQGSLSERVALPGRRDELRELADAFDAMLDRVEAHVAEQRRFASNASHELRTPLAVTKTLLEVARDDPDRDVDDLLRRLATVNTRAIDLTEALLVLSRADQRTFTPEPVDLSLLAEQAAETLLPLAERRGLAIVVDGAPAEAFGSPTLLLQLVTNLVHNAIVHNEPEQGRVWIRVRPAAGHVDLEVENTGAPVSPDQVATLTERFRRGAGRTHTDHPGVGLGLAIVKSITQAHDGRLTLAPRDGGGLRVTVRLPAAPPT
ncbi:sensor histidine kinase [Xylanimonas ulmi]|uniref:histidine kinase n=1 Tax=Xylanimonas ulmi TaxID=228973 RepID=A0A4Q7M2R0_9MICO|nr:HAMP domain-containing sensor histidine kinase [Xylanibacterium ulmi]RZS61253.1 two-component system sensor histidine kinase VanS [Xylanibacterium ulmi]